MLLLMTIFDSPEQVFELIGSGEYIGPEEIKKYNFNNINDIIEILMFILEKKLVKVFYRILV